MKSAKEEARIRFVRSYFRKFGKRLAPVVQRMIENQTPDARQGDIQTERLLVTHCRCENGIAYDLGVYLVGSPGVRKLKINVLDSDELDALACVIREFVGWARELGATR